MNRPRLMQTLPKSRSKGWIMLEVVLCLALFAVVLSVLQRQGTAQWQSLQRTEAQRKLDWSRSLARYAELDERRLPRLSVMYWA